MSYSEEVLVSEPTGLYLRDNLGWELGFGYNEETFGTNGTFGRKSDHEVVLTRYLKKALEDLNPGYPEEAYTSAIQQLVSFSSSQSTLQTNKEKHKLLIDGVDVQFTNNKGEREKRTLKVIDFDEPTKNHFLAIREFWVHGSVYHKRPDLVGFVNGLPLIVMEFKNVNKGIWRAYKENIADYKDTIPHLFHFNLLIAISNGFEGKIGSLTSKYEHFNEWKRLSEGDPGSVDLETLLKGVCNKKTLLDLLENFTLFDESKEKTVKIVARNHQYLGVNQAIQSVEDRKKNNGKLGVFWHTQGSGKSYSMVFFTHKIRRRLGSGFTFLVLTDREDLDTQIYKTFAGCGLADNDKDPCRAKNGDHLQELLGQHKAFIFTLVQKFNKDVDPNKPYSDRDDIIVISDEAHRSQYGRLSLNLRNALPFASYIGFTGTPLFKDDEITRRVFGNYVSTYDFQRAVEDNATVPLYYDNRGEKLGIQTDELNEQIAQKLEEYESDDIDVQQKLEKELKREYHIITAKSRLKQIARDFVQHYSTQWESGKAMLVCIDKITCVRLYNFIKSAWRYRIKMLEKNLKATTDEQEATFLERQITWMKETQMAVVISEEQGEVDKFRKWGLDVVAHRKLIREGFETNDPKQPHLELEDAFKKENHPLRVAIVCAMWLTGFDVPSLSTLYLDKPLKAHTLMQAIARANRVNEGKNNGLIVDYGNILKSLRRALATFAGHTGNDSEKPKEIDPVKPAEEDLIADLDEAINIVKVLLNEQNFVLSRITDAQGFDRNRAILDAKEAVNQSDESRKRFEVSAREVFKKFKACLPVQGINDYRKPYDAINIIYKSLQDDREKADITDILRELHAIVDDAVATSINISQEDRIYDISKIDFERLKKEFEKSPKKNTTVQNLRDAIETKLNRLVMQNPLRTNFQAHYEMLCAEYNREKDHVTIERTFEALMQFVKELAEEEKRAIKEGFEGDQEVLTLFDILVKPELSKKEIDRIKRVAKMLLDRLKAEKLKIDSWWEKESTRDAVKVEIENFLYSDETGLPLSYGEEEIKNKRDKIFSYLYSQYQNGQVA